MNKRFKPQYLPDNDDAEALVESLAAELQLTLKGIAGGKHRTILSSFLYCVQEAGVSAFLGWAGGTTSKDTTGVSFFPATGAKTVRAVRAKLVEAGYVTLFDNLPSGIGDMTNKEAVERMGSSISDGRFNNIGSYRINTKPIFNDLRFTSAQFVDAQRPYVMVNQPEEYLDKRERKAAGSKAPKLSWDEVYKGDQGREASAAAKPVKEMNAFWAKHPLTLPATNTHKAQHYACATRIFHDGSLVSGGRWYGGWTNLESHKRLHLRIDDEPICEIDLNASQPTLFSALLGIRMNVGGDTWTDVYASVVERLNADEDPKRLRMMVKQVLVEMIGSGNHKRRGPADTKAPKGKDKLDFKEVPLFFDTEHSKKLYQDIQVAALEVFPALKQLDDGYLNSTGFLSYHEAEILTRTLLKLKAMGVVAYGVNDCAVVKQSDRDAAVKTYRETVRSYVTQHQKQHKHPHLDIEVSVTIEQLGLDKVKLPGCYIR